MPEITRRRTGELLRKLFDILISEPGMSARDALARLEGQVELTPYESGSYQSGSRRFEHILRFATVDCVKAGWIAKEKGKWTITEAGRQAHLQYQDPEAFYKRAVQLYKEWKANRPDSEPESSVESEDPQSGKAARVTFEQAEEQAWSEIEHYLRGMHPYEFQELVADLLRAMGYHVSWIAPPGKDGGTDIVAHVDPLGTRSPRIKVQVKRQGQTINADGLRSFMAVLGDDDVGLFVSIGGFTKDAADEARGQQRRKITLLNLEALFDLWVEHYPKLTDEARRRLPLKPIHFLEPGS